MLSCACGVDAGSWLMASPVAMKENKAVRQMLIGFNKSKGNRFVCQPGI
jgi:hypothetical protein